MRQAQDNIFAGVLDAKLCVKRVGLHEEAAARLRELIMRGDLKPQQQLNESELSEALGVSRTPLREALKLLVIEGLIDLRRNRSPVVSSLDSEKIASLFEAVAGIERVAAELAATRMTARDLQKLKSLHNRMERYNASRNLAGYFNINNEIHSFIVMCSKNPVLKSCHDTLLTRVKRARFMALTTLGRREESVREHREFLEAIEARDAVRAGKILQRHVLGTGQAVDRGLRSGTIGESYGHSAGKSALKSALKKEKP